MTSKESMNAYLNLELSGRMIIQQTEVGSVGVDSVFGADQIVVFSDLFEKVERGSEIIGHQRRKKWFGNVWLKVGGAWEERQVWAKEKTYASWYTRVREKNRTVDILNQADDLRKSRGLVSVLQEIQMATKCQEALLSLHDLDVVVEKPLGFIISRKVDTSARVVTNDLRRRWIIYENLPIKINDQNLPEVADYSDFFKVKACLRKLGIKIGELPFTEDSRAASLFNLDDGRLGLLDLEGYYLAKD
jgi:hypothetical protein